MADTSYRLERLSPSQFARVAELYKAVHKKSLEPDFFKKKFATEYTGVSNIGYLALDQNDEPAAFYGVFPTLFELENETVLVAQSGDTMTHPDHRRRGLFQKLFEATQELAAANQIQFLFGFPNESSYPGFIKFGWDEPTQIITFEKNLQSSLVGKAKRRLIKSRVQTHLLSDFSQEREKLENECKFAKTNFFSARVDGNFLRYKRFGKNYLADMEGTHVWFQVSDCKCILHVGLMSSYDARDFDAVESLANILHCATVRFDATPQSIQAEAIRNVGGFQERDGLPVICLPLSAQLFPTNLLDITRADWDTF